MSPSSRDAFLARVRAAVQAGNQPGSAAPAPERGRVGYQGAGPDPVGRFCREWQAAGGVAHVVPDADAAARKVLELLPTAGGRVLLGEGPVLDRLALDECLAGGYAVTRTRDLTPADGREPFFAAAVGVSGVEYLIAET